MWPIPLPRLLAGVEMSARGEVRTTDVEPAMRQALEAAGVLSFAGIADWYGCSDCAEGGCPVMLLGEQADGTSVYQVLCQHGDIIRPTDAELSCWTYSAHGLADAFAHWLGVAQTATPLIPQRLWSLGESIFAGVPVTWFFGAGTTQADARAVFRGQPVFRAAAQAVVLTPALSPPMDLLGDTVLLWPCAQLLQIEQGEVRFSPAALEALAREVVARATPPSGMKPKAQKWLDVPAGTTWDQIVITFVNTDAITIQAPGMPHGESFSYDELGFIDDRSSNPEADVFTHSAYWRRFLRFAYCYLPDECVPKAVWAGDEIGQIDQVKSWAHRINQRLHAVVPGVAAMPAPIVGKRGVYTTSFLLVVGEQFVREMTSALKRL